MKKIFTLAAAVLFTIGAFAQDDTDEDNTSDKGAK